ncbi:hypothetical protein ACJX0J_005708 [Zea mays]
MQLSFYFFGMICDNFNNCYIHEIIQSLTHVSNEMIKCIELNLCCENQKIVYIIFFLIMIIILKCFLSSFSVDTVSIDGGTLLKHRKRRVVCCKKIIIDIYCCYCYCCCCCCCCCCYYYYYYY